MNAKQLRIVFMGTPEFAVPSLRALVAGGYNVVGVVTAPDKPAGRGQKLRESEVKIAAREAHLPVLQPEKLRAPEFVEALKALDPDLGIVIAFRMLPEIIWSMPRLGSFNLHASLLPQYRGAAPINRAIMNGETETGVTTFLLNHEIDKGAILAQKRMPILPEDNAGTLYDKLMHAGTQLVTDTVDRIAAGDITPLEQHRIDEATLHPAPKIFKDDCRIDWSQRGSAIVNLIRGLSPHPGAWTMLQREAYDPCGTNTANRTDNSAAGNTASARSGANLATRADATTGGSPQTGNIANISGSGAGSAESCANRSTCGTNAESGSRHSATAAETAKIYSARFEPAVHAEPLGTVESDCRTFIRIACADGWIVPKEIQLAGKKRLGVRELLLGWRDVLQYRFGD